MSMLASSLCVDVYNLLSKSLAISMWLHKIYACFGTFVVHAEDISSGLPNNQYLSLFPVSNLCCTR